MKDNGNLFEKLKESVFGPKSSKDGNTAYHSTNKDSWEKHELELQSSKSIETGPRINIGNNEELKENPCSVSNFVDSEIPKSGCESVMATVEKINRMEVSKSDYFDEIGGDFSNYFDTENVKREFENQFQDRVNEKDEKVTSLEGEIAELKVEKIKYEILEDEMKALREEVKKYKTTNSISQTGISECSVYNKGTSSNIFKAEFVKIIENAPVREIPKNEESQKGYSFKEAVVTIEGTSDSTGEEIPMGSFEVSCFEETAEGATVPSDKGGAVETSENPAINEIIVTEENTIDFGHKVEEPIADPSHAVSSPALNNDEAFGKEKENNTVETNGQVSEEEVYEKLSKQIHQLNQEVARKFKIDESKDKIIDNLHRELQGYKDNQTKDLVKPIILDLIMMIDRTKKQADEFDQAKDQYPQKLVNVIKDFVQDLEDILYRQGIDSYNCETEDFDAKQQYIVKRIKVDDPLKDKKVAEVVGNGYIWDEKIVRPERVNVYVYDQSKSTINID
ncbi:nucleotide exchange factor GrpE [Neobacillus sp. SAB-20_R2A]|uniref:nucleotide exchange factor GrpE n=1 Tax=Neobacillus sp. SAB-20_R2A TaxID=3120519 RepID=UPI003C6E2A35